MENVVHSPDLCLCIYTYTYKPPSTLHPRNTLVYKRHEVLNHWRPEDTRLVLRVHDEEDEVNDDTEQDEKKEEHGQHIQKYIQSYCECGGR